MVGTFNVRDVQPYSLEGADCNHCSGCRGRLHTHHVQRPLPLGSGVAGGSGLNNFLSRGATQGIHRLHLTEGMKT